MKNQNLLNSRMKFFSAIGVGVALLFVWRPAYADEIAGSVPSTVCGRELATFVLNHMGRYARKVIKEKTRIACARHRVHPDLFSRVYSVEDVFQEVLLAFLESRKFNPGHHGSVTELTVNNHLKQWVVSQIRWQTYMLVQRVKRAIKTIETPTFGQPGETRQMDFVDPESLRSVLDQVAENSVPGGEVESSIPKLMERASISLEQWKELLSAGPRWIRTSCEAHGIEEKDFWSSSRGAFTAADFAEELLYQAMEWQQEYGPINREQAINAVVIVTTQKMVEEITGFLAVRERALSWMTKKGKNHAVAAQNYRQFFVKGEPTDKMMEKDGSSKARVSFRKRSCQRAYDAHAQILIQYPEVLSFPTAARGDLELNDDDYLRIIMAIESKLKKDEQPAKRLHVIRELVLLLRPYLAVEGNQWRLKLQDRKLRSLVKSLAS